MSFNRETYADDLLQLAGGQNVSFSHDDADIGTTLGVYQVALAALAEAVRAGDVARRLEGRVVEPVFRRP